MKPKKQHMGVEQEGEVSGVGAGAALSVEKRVTCHVSVPQEGAEGSEGEEEVAVEGEEDMVVVMVGVLLGVADLDPDGDNHKHMFSDFCCS